MTHKTYKRLTEKKTVMNVCELITKRILEQLEKGTIPWRKPFETSHEIPKNINREALQRG